MREVKEGGKTHYHIILRETPFYPEGGGQISDTGYLRKGHQKIAVKHVYKELDTIIHVVEALPRDPEGEWHAVIDIPRREAVTIHHTATHLLHAALRDTLGPHARQNGSLVAPDKLRFDFTHPMKLSEEGACSNRKYRQ
jgi:Alanyl-tRNA synthetase